MRTLCKISGWTELGDNRFEKSFGPIKATIDRHWDYSQPDPDYYYCWLNVGGEQIRVYISELGCEWFDDKVERLVCRAFDKKVKAVIKGWAK